MQVRKFSLLLLSGVLAVAGTSTVHAQQVQTGGSNAGGAASSAGVGTTEALGGLTTEALGGGAADGGLAGANTATTFVGGNNAGGGFVGGAREAVAGGAANRQFRGITDTGVFGGGNQQQTGTPRRIPVAFRVAFTAPPMMSSVQTGALAPANNIGVQRYLPLRPQLSGINVEVSPRGVVTLTGAVPDASSRRLAANLLRLQPGVRTIQNDLQVQP